MNSTKEGTKICHLTSAHESNDDRIDLKECFSLCKAGYRVFLVAKGNSRIDNGVRIVGVGNPPKHRLGRFLFFANRIYKKAFSLDCEIYHLHDPELLPYGVKLKHRGKKVIFDSHEDVPAQILDKEWIPAFLRVLISNLYKRYETHAVKQFDAVVAATPHIGEQFYGRAKKVVVINNYPRLDDIVFHDTPFSEREPIACYAGGISEQRGEKVMVQAMTGVEGTLIMAGAHPETDKTNQCKQLSNGGGYPI